MGISTAAVGIERKWGGKRRDAAVNAKKILVLFRISLSQSFPFFGEEKEFLPFLLGCDRFIPSSSRLLGFWSLEKGGMGFILGWNDNAKLGFGVIFPLFPIFTTFLNPPLVIHLYSKAV